MIIHTVHRTRIAVFSLMAVFALGGGTAQAQEVINRSFEQDDQFSLMGWQVTDPLCQEAYDQAPPEGGVWSLKLHRRNFQGGCFGVAYQVIPQVQQGAILRVTAWVRLPSQEGRVARLYWTKFAPSDTSGFLPYVPAPFGAIATSTSDQWTALTLIERLDVAEGDSLGIVLDAGVTSGPTSDDDFAYFDLISIDHASEQDLREQDLTTGIEEHPEAPVFARAHNFPNPFQTATTLSFTLNRPALVTLDVYDLLGRKVETLIAGQLREGTHSAVWEAGDLPDGLYVARLRADEQVRTLKLVRMQ